MLLFAFHLLPNAAVAPGYSSNPSFCSKQIKDQKRKLCNYRLLWHFRITMLVMKKSFRGYHPHHNIMVINTNIIIIIKKTNLQLNVTLDPATATSAFSGVVVITGEAVVGLFVQSWWWCYNDTDDRDFDHDFQDLGHGLNDDNDYEEVSAPIGQNCVRYWHAGYLATGRLWFADQTFAIITREQLVGRNDTIEMSEEEFWWMI